MGKYNEVLKGLLLAFKPRFEFSLSQVPGFIPADCQSVFYLTWSSYLYPIYPTASRSQGGTYGKSNITSLFSITCCCCPTRQA
jgi:hypothetical protein